MRKRIASMLAFMLFFVSLGSINVLMIQYQDEEVRKSVKYILALREKYYSICS